MKSIRTRISHGIFAFAVAGAVGFGATQAFAAPASVSSGRANNCETCAQQCGTIKLCSPGFCQCAVEPT
ncbi:MAG TPA: hypothetical protein VLK84_26435 [Longimicrobium sp.]|nr:hypothetical protein [Longimicrobium sp.]